MRTRFGKFKIGQEPTDKCLLHVMVSANGEYTDEYEVRKELLLIRGNRIDLLIYISNLLGDHEMPGARLTTLTCLIDLTYAPDISQRGRSYISLGTGPAHRG